MSLIPGALVAKAETAYLCNRKGHAPATWHRFQTVQQKTMRARPLPKLAICFVCCLPTLLFAQQKSPEGAQILALEKKWTESYKHRDISLLSSLLAEDFIITIEDVGTYGKAGYISHSADSCVHVDVAELSEFKVRMHGETAVVTGAYHETGESKGKHYEYHDRLTDVWMKKDGKWRVIASHYSVPLK